MSSPISSGMRTPRFSSPGIHDELDTPIAQDVNALSALRISDKETMLSYTTAAATPLTCLCYDDQVSRIAEYEIKWARYRLKTGLIYLLDEDDAMKKAQRRVTDLITNAAHDAKVDVIDEAPDDHSCKGGETAQLKAWQRWHVECKCYEAERHFNKVMDEDPQREDRQRRQERFKAVWVKKHGSYEKPPELIGTENHDVRGRLPHMHPVDHSTFPGCKCVLWGAGKMGDAAWIKAISSFNGMYPVASAWGNLLATKIQESIQVALEEIRELVSESAGCKGQKAGVVKDHFLEWQQAIVKKRVDIAVEETKKAIMIEKGVAGAVAKAAAEAAEEHYYQYRMTVAAKEAARKEESLRAPGGLAAVEQMMESAETT